MASTASAQGHSDIDIQTFEPGLGPHAIYTVDQTGTLSHFQPAGQLVFSYLSEPLVSETDGTTTSIVDQQLVADVLGGIGLGENGQLGIHLPFYLINNGTFEGESFDGATVGDLSLIPKYQFLNPKDSPVGLGLLVDVALPTGDGEAFVGAPSVEATPKVLVDAEFGGLSLATNLGVEITGSSTLGPNVDVDDRFSYQFGAEYEIVDGLVDVGGELYGTTPLQDFFGSSDESPLEGILGAKVRTKPGIVIMAGGGGGFVPGIGAPEFRAFVGVSYPNKVIDSDGDGINDDEDDCPDAKEDLDGFEDADGCPDQDNDGDGIEDDADKCPDKAEDKNGYQDDDGCPDGDNDKDGDGVSDAEDECPEEPEDKDEFEDDDGCPDTDNDKDGLADADDDCPDEAEDEDGFEDDDGCPDTDNDRDGIADADDECPNKPGLKAQKGCPAKKKKAVRKEEEIKILEKVYFEYDKAVIKEESYDVLDQVGLILRTNPDIEEIEIQGHTDDIGSDEYNRELSRQRAKAVKQYLSEKAGIDEGRLLSEGFGSSQPLVPNNSDKNRAKNRRVEFKILKQ